MGTMTAFGFVGGTQFFNSRIDDVKLWFQSANGRPSSGKSCLVWGGIRRIYSISGCSERMKSLSLRSLFYWHAHLSMYVHCDVYIHDIHVYVYLHGSTSRHMDAYLCFSALRVTWFLSIPFTICIYWNQTKLVTKPRNNQTLNLRVFHTKTDRKKKRKHVRPRLRILNFPRHRLKDLCTLGKHPEWLWLLLDDFRWCFWEPYDLQRDSSKIWWEHIHVLQMAIDVDILYCYTKRYDEEMKKRRHAEMKKWMILDKPKLAHYFQCLFKVRNFRVLFHDSCCTPPR